MNNKLQTIIDQSQALVEYDPESIKPVRTLSLKKCLACAGQTDDNKICNSRPCSRCVRLKRPYTVRIDNRTTIRYYSVEARLDKFEETEVTYYYTCDQRLRHGFRYYNGDGKHLCNECVSYAENFNKPPRCYKPHPSGGILSYSFSNVHNQRLTRKISEARKRARVEELSDTNSDSDDDPPTDARKIDDNLLESPLAKKERKRARQVEDDALNAEVTESLTRSKAKIRGFASTKPTCMLTKAVIAYGPEPQNRREALAQPDASQWRNAMKDEYDSLIKNDTWDVVTKPQDRKVLTGRWVFKRKLGPDGSVAKHKARFVVRGFTQIYGLDFDETYASVVKAPSYRLLFALAARYGWKCHQMDVKTAFLNGDLEHEIYVYSPEGFPEQKGQVLKLKKSLYGLKQSPRQWYNKLSSFLLEHGWKVSRHDASIFFKPGIFVSVYVDDMKILGAHDEEIIATKNLLHSRFEMTDLGPCSYYLGMHVIQGQDGSFHLHQAGYVQQILERFDLQDIHPRQTPMRTDTKLTKNEGSPAPLLFQREYQQKVGSLLYATCITRLDIAHAVGVVSRYCSNPTKEHMAAVDDIFAYLKGTPNLGPIYKRDASNLHAYVDADHGGCKDTYRSTTGYTLMLSDAPIAWASKRQTTVAMSTCEAEYVAGYKAAQELTWMQGLIDELGVPGIQTMHTPLFIDNNSTLSLTRNPEHHDRTKHIALKYHYLREVTIAGKVDTQRVASKDNVADVLTKPLPRETFQTLTRKMGLKEASCKDSCKDSDGDTRH